MGQNYLCLLYTSRSARRLHGDLRSGGRTGERQAPAGAGVHPAHAGRCVPCNGVISAVGGIKIIQQILAEVWKLLHYPEGRLHEDDFVAHRLFWRCATKSSSCRRPSDVYKRQASALPKCSIRHQVLSALLAWHLPHLARRIGT